MLVASLKGIMLVLLGGFDSVGFDDRSTEARGLGTGDDGFCTGEGDPGSSLVDPFLVTLLTLGVADEILWLEASGKLTLPWIFTFIRISSLNLGVNTAGKKLSEIFDCVYKYIQLSAIS